VLETWPAASDAAENQRQHKQHNKYDKQNLGDTSRTGGDTTEAEYGSDDGDNKKYGSPIKHVSLLVEGRAGTSSITY
jgi:hypothetical protein